MARSAFVSCFFAGAGSVTIGSMGQGAEFTKCITTSDLTTKTLDDDITLVDRVSGGCCPADSVPGIKMYNKYQGAQIVCGFKADGTIAMTSSTSGGATTCTTNKCYVMKQNIPCKDGTKQRLNGCCGPKPQTNFQDNCLDYDKSQTFNGVAADYCLTYNKKYDDLNTKSASDDIKDNVLQVDKIYSYTPCEGSSTGSGSTSTGSGSTSTGSGSTSTGSGSSSTGSGSSSGSGSTSTGSNNFALCPGKTEKTSASSEKCTTDASSCTPGLCYTTPACCGSKTFSCSAETYKDAKKSTSALGALAANWQTNCCTTRATCSSATCPAGSKKKAGVDATKCLSDAASCNTWSILNIVTNTCCETDDTTCFGTAVLCSLQLPLTTSYNDPAKAGNAKGTDFKANCCTTRATCSSSTCPAGFKKKAGVDATKCTTDVASCGSSCCEATTCSSKAFLCSAGTYRDANKVNSTAGALLTNWRTNCCTTTPTCSSATCPAGSKKKAGVDATKCLSDPASCNTWSILNVITNTCCETDSTTCFGTAVFCTTGTYNDPAKAGNAKGADFQANCCTNRATCSMAWSENDVSVATRGTVAAAAVGAIIVAMATLM